MLKQANNTGCENISRHTHRTGSGYGGEQEVSIEGQNKPNTNSLCLKNKYLKLKYTVHSAGI